MIVIKLTEDEAARLVYSLEDGTAKRMEGGHLTNMDVVVPFAQKISELTGRHQDLKYLDQLKKHENGFMFAFGGPRNLDIQKTE